MRPERPSLTFNTNLLPIIISTNVNFDLDEI